MKIELEPIGFIHSARLLAEDDFWGGSRASIELVESLPAECLDGLEDFSHIEIIYYFHQVEEANVMRGSRHPRQNPAWPRLGIFAQRAKNRPNRLGLSTVRLLSREGRTLHVSELDALDGTPVLDIKPVMAEFLPRGALRQPAWVSELMREYWSKPEQEEG